MNETPAWFAQALAAPYDEASIEVEGCVVRYLRWGERGRPGLVLVHGGAAHSRWWGFLAPLLARHYDVVALDMSGHGTSGWRTRYPRELWAAEVVAVAAHAQFEGPPVVIGHSLGGLVAIVAAALHGDALAGAIIVDSPVHLANPESREGRYGRSFRSPKVYPDAETAVRKFRLVPQQPCANGFVLDYVARASLRAVDGGVTWKFDPRLFDEEFQDQMSGYLAGVRCRVALMRGEHSAVVPLETSAYMVELLARTAPLVEIPDAYHHLILDQPLAFIAATRALLADWEHSTPNAVLAHNKRLTEPNDA